MNDGSEAALSRREVVAGLSAVAAVAASPAVARAGRPGATGLHQLAAARGLRFGSAIGYGSEGSATGSIGNLQYRAIIERECGMIVPENEMKWQAVRPAPDQFDFRAFDAIVRYAKSRDLAVRGHTLLWHRPKWLPQWVNVYDYGAHPATEAARLITQHIETVTRRYSGIIHSYDVVNELFDDQTGAFVDTSLSTAMGSHEAVVDLAFHTARHEAPGAELVYNDYMSWEPGMANHRAAVLRLLEGFRKRGVPCDALGIQSHIEMRSIDRTTGIGPYDLKEWRAFLDAVTGMGYRLLITELDVKDNALPADYAARDAGVARYLRAYMEVMLAYPQLRDVMAWGMVDSFSWLQGFAPRADNLPQRCCPYGADYKPRPMRDTLANLFAGAEARPPHA